MAEISDRPLTSQNIDPKSAIADDLAAIGEGLRNLATHTLQMIDYDAEQAVKQFATNPGKDNIPLLLNCSREQIAKISEEWQKQYPGSTFKGYVGAYHFSDGEMLQIEMKFEKGGKSFSEMRDERLLPVARAIYEAMEGFGADERAIVSELVKLNPAERGALKRVYYNEYNTPMKEQILEEVGIYRGDVLSFLNDEQDLEYLNSLEYRAKLIHEELDNWNIDEAKIVSRIFNLSNEERQALKTTYKAMYGESLEDRLKSELYEADYNVVLSYLNQVK